MVYHQNPFQNIKHWLLKMHAVHMQNIIKCQVPITWVKHWLLHVQTGHYKMCVCVVPPWPFSISQSHSSNSCALAIAFGSDKQSKWCRTHWVIVIAMKNKGNNNKPILKSCDYHKHHKDTTPLMCVCLPSHGHIIIHSIQSTGCHVTS
jgi:hypothetical protein